MGDKILRRQPERLGAEEVDDADHKGHYLADDRSQSRAGHSPVEAENKDRVQDDIYDGPGQHGGHRPGGTAVGPDHRVHHVHQHIGWEKGKDDVEILHRHPDGIFRRAEQSENLLLQREKDSHQDEADQEGDRDAAADTGGGVFRVLLSLTDVQIGGTAVTKAPGKCLSDNEDGEHHAGGGISQSTHLAVSDKDLIHDVIERADQKGEDAGDGELQHQFRDLLLSQIVCLLFRPHGLTSVYLVSWSLYQRKAA